MTIHSAIKFQLGAIALLSAVSACSISKSKGDDKQEEKKESAPALPDDVVSKTREKYIEAYERLTGKPFAWK